uniref:AT22983p n=1 Tax=Drosophila melanogaster TaxID=7227 RepID=Q8MSM1_DROME|nr:AT22983p [Drosophila melanogaster]
MDMGAVLGDRASLRALTQSKVFLIRDLDELTTEDELKSALEAQAEIPAAVVAIKSLRKTQYGGKTAVIAVPANLADPLIKRGRVGWSQCLIKELEPRQRCFRCLEEGHIAAHCRSTVDRSQCCFRCGTAGHKAECPKEAKCFLCASRGNQATSADGAPDVATKAREVRSPLPNANPSTEPAEKLSR